MDVHTQVLQALDIMFTVITVGLVVIMGIFTVPQFLSRVLSVLPAFWASALIRVKLDVLRNGKNFSLVQYEISSTVMLILIQLFYMRPNRAILQGLPAVNSVKLFLVGLGTTACGMGVFFASGPPVTVFFPGDLGVYLITMGLTLVIYGHRRSHLDGVPLIVYILVLLAVTYIADDR